MTVYSLRPHPMSSREPGWPDLVCAGLIRPEVDGPAAYRFLLAAACSSPPHTRNPEPPYGLFGRPRLTLRPGFPQFVPAVRLGVPVICLCVIRDNPSLATLPYYGLPGALGDWSAIWKHYQRAIS